MVVVGTKALRTKALRTTQGLKTKANGGSRPVFAYMSVGQFDSRRYNWQSAWDRELPGWIESPDPNFPSSFWVHYWHPAWEAELFGSANAWLDRVLDRGYDGIFLDVLDVYTIYYD